MLFIEGAMLDKVVRVQTPFCNCCHGQ